MFIDGGDERLLGCHDKVPNYVARGGWTDVVVVSPGEIDRTGDATGPKFFSSSLRKFKDSSPKYSLVGL